MHPGLENMYRIEIDGSVYLSEIRPEDKAAYIECFKEKEIADRTLTIPFPYTEKDFDWWVAHVADETKKHGHPFNWAIRDSKGHLIGAIGLSRFQGARAHIAELGYWLAKPYWAQGIMSRVARRFCDAAFTDWDLVRITAHVFSFNIGSARVLEKCGFNLEGVLRKNSFKNGQYLDDKLYALVR
jgi:[ribosomal protein S5]-alanine N-acetyltransferase